MVPILAKNAVIIKCGYPNAGIVGNYECAYGLGVLAVASGQEKIYKIESIRLLKEQVFDGLNGYKPEDGKEMQLVKILTEYEPDSVFDNQMIELYNMGYDEEKPRNI